MVSKFKAQISVYKMSDYVGAFVLSTFYIFSQYNMTFMSIGLNLLFLYAIYRIIKEGKIKLNKPFFLFLVFALINQLINYAISNTFLLNKNTYFFMLFAYIMIIGGSLVDKKIFIKVYSFVCVVTSMLIVYQYILINFLGERVNAIRLFKVAEEDMHFWNTGAMRPMGVFTEPQAFCSYIIPLLVYKISNNELKFSFFITLIILLTGSSQGILVAAMIWCYYYLVQEKKYIQKVFFIMASMLFLSFILNSTFFDETLSKIASIDIFGYDIRLTKGFMIYGAMPIKDKIMGIGFGNLGEYLRSGNFSFEWMNLTRPQLFAYVTTMSNVLISFGFGGIITYINIFILNRKCKNASKIILWVIFVISFSQTILFNAWFVFYWIIFFIFDDEQNENKYFCFYFPRNKI